MYLILNETKYWYHFSIAGKDFTQARDKIFHFIPKAVSHQAGVGLDSMAASDEIHVGRKSLKTGAQHLICFNVCIITACCPVNYASATD